MTWLRPVDRTSGTLTLSAGTLSCLAHHGTPLSKRCPTTTALEHTIVPMDDAERMPPLGAVKPRQKFFNVIHRAAPLEFRHERRAAGWALCACCCSAGFWLGLGGEWVKNRSSRTATAMAGFTSISGHNVAAVFF